MPINPTPPPVGLDDSLRQPPAELLGYLITHGLLPFNAEGFLQRGDIKPAFLLFALGDDPCAVADQAVHKRDPSAVAFAFHSVRLGHIFRHENVCFDPSSSCVSSQGAGCVSGGWNSQFP